MNAGVAAGKTAGRAAVKAASTTPQRHTEENPPPSTFRTARDIRFSEAGILLNRKTLLQPPGCRYGVVMMLGAKRFSARSPATRLPIRSPLFRWPCELTVLIGPPRTKSTHKLSCAKPGANGEGRTPM